MAEGTNVATVNRSRGAATSDSAASVKSEKEQLREEIENKDAEPSKAQHQPIVPKRRGKGAYYFICLSFPTIFLKPI